MNKRWQNQRQADTSRVGVSLVHTIVMIVVAGSLTTLSMSVVYQTYASHHRAVEHINRWQRLNLLRERFCDDAHRSTSAEIDEILVLSAGNEEFTYELEGDEVIRTHKSQGTLVGKQSWVLPSPVSCNWRIDESGALPLLRWELSWGHGYTKPWPDQVGVAKLEETTSQRQLTWLKRIRVFEEEFDLQANGSMQGGSDVSE